MLKSFVPEARTRPVSLANQMQVLVHALIKRLRKVFRARILLAVGVFRKAAESAGLTIIFFELVEDAAE